MGSKTKMMGPNRPTKVWPQFWPLEYNTRVWWANRQTDGYRSMASTALAHSVAR